MRYTGLYPWQVITRGLPMSCRLDLSFSVEKLQDDFAKIAEHYIPRQQYDVYHSGGWNAICLHALDGRVDADWGGDGDYRKTPALALAPYIEQIIDSFKCEKKRVRLLGLPPGENVFWHMDDKENYESGVVRIHVPIWTNDDVEFQISHENLHWRPGETWYGDFSFPHRLRNRGHEVRTHLVLDLVVNEFISELFPEIIKRNLELRYNSRLKCRSFYNIYNMKFSMKRYARSIKQKPQRVIPKALELLGVKKRKS